MMKGIYIQAGRPNQTMQGVHGGTVHGKTQTLIYQQNQEFILVSTNRKQERSFLG